MNIGDKKNFFHHHIIHSSRSNEGDLPIDHPAHRLVPELLAARCKPLVVFSREIWKYKNINLSRTVGV